MVEGTEFAVALTCSSTVVSVFEGRVSAAAAVEGSPPLSIGPGEEAVLGPGRPSGLAVMARPVDAVRWALYYPPLGTSAGATGSDLECLPALAPESQAACLPARAGSRLAVGRVDETTADIAAARALQPASGEPDALLSIISLTQGERSRALELAQHAVSSDPASARSWLALSYAQQGNFQLNEALESTRRALAQDPGSAVAGAREAELLLSLGYRLEAERAGRAAVQRSGADGRASAVLGFIQLAGGNAADAGATFASAREREPADPLPHLGAGLALIRQGRLSHGRQELEIAVLLDPSSSLLRSYLGKAYYEENETGRDALASTEFELAREKDPLDPTPWLYAAILLQSTNRAPDAYAALLQSLARNDYRAVYRSRLGLDEDRAARAVNLVSIYDSLGFGQAARREASAALASDPSNGAAHRLLGDAYAGQPRSQIASESELLQSQLLRPLSADAVAPLRPLGRYVNTQNKLGEQPLPPGLGLGRAGLNEYTALFERDQAGVFLDSLVGGNSTLLAQASVAALKDRVALAAAQGHFESQDARSGQRVRQNVYTGFAQVSPGSDTRLQLGITQWGSDRDTIVDSFDPLAASPVQSTDEGTRGRLGLYQALSPSAELLATVARQSLTSEILYAGSPVEKDQTQSTVSEAQLRLRLAGANLLLGGSWVNTGSQTNAGGTPIGMSSASAYAYGQTGLWTGRLDLTLGVTAETSQVAAVRDNRLDPKLGLVWHATPETSLRLASTRSVARPTFGDQTLEPTQVAGFGQFFEDHQNGVVSKQLGMGLEHRLSRTSVLGLEFTQRNVRLPFYIPDRVDVEWREQSARAWSYLAIPRGTLGWLPRNWSAALTGELEYEKLARDLTYTGPESILTLESCIASFGGTLFLPQGLRARARLSLVNQTGVLASLFTGIPVPVESRFWAADLALSYELPRRHGRITLAGQNLLHGATAFVEGDPSMPHLATGRLITLRLTLDL